MTFDDESLIASLKEDDRISIKYIYQHYYPKLLNLLKKYGAEEEDAKDLMQMSIVDLIQNLKRGKFNGTARLESYFLSIAKFKWYTLVKSKKRFTTENIDNLSEEWGTETDDKEDIQSMENAVENELNQLKEDCHKLIVLFYYHKKSMEEIAKELGYTSAFVRVKKNRCMGAFKKQLLENSLIQKIYPNARS